MFGIAFLLLTLTSTQKTTLRAASGTRTLSLKLDKKQGFNY